VVAQDYEINLKAEVEIMALHEKLDLIRLGDLEVMLSNQLTQLMRATLTKRLPS
jgi:uncharacterized membrane protein